jgi:NADH-ubiquinone oxidoreductase chain 5
MTFSLGVFLTLLTSITTGFAGRFLGYRGTKFFVLTGAFATVCINTWNLIYINEIGLTTVDLGEFISFDLLVINWVLIFDVLACLMVWMVSVVSASIQLFSCFYMRFDPHFIRFMVYLTLFTFFMFLFITSGNFMYVIWGWEGIGICSYLLITFWYTRVQANKSALKALLVNKIGDIGLLLGIVLVFYFIKSIDLLSVFSLAQLISSVSGDNFFPYYMLFFGFFLAIIAKSAQFGLHI